MKVRVIYNPDETVWVIVPNPRTKKPLETESMWLERTFKRSMEAQNIIGYDYEDMDDSLLPGRTTRNSWRGNKESGIWVDADKVEADITEKKIMEEKEHILRQMAIDSLQAKGEIS